MTSMTKIERCIRFGIFIIYYFYASVFSLQVLKALCIILSALCII